MATVQIHASGSVEDIPKCQTSVLVSPYWGGGWLVVPYLNCDLIDQVAAPSVSQCVLSWRSGEIAQAGSSGFAAFSAINLEGWFVRVLVHSAVGTYVGFTGVVLGETQENISIRARDLLPKSDQFLTAVGLEHLLKQGRVQGSYVGAGALFIERTLHFNVRNQWGLSLNGNRSNSPGGAGVYTFSGDGAVWSHLDILNYVLHFHHPGVSFSIIGQTGPLAAMQGRFDFTGKDVWSVIETLIDRRRGLGWYVTSDDAQAYIVVYSIAPDPITVDGFTIPANGFQALWAAMSQVSLQPTVKISRAHAVGRVIALGAPVKVMLTLALANDTIERGWTDAQQTAYDAADDKERGTDKFRRVYCYFRVPRDWGWTYTGLQSGGTQIANPSHTNDGKILPNEQGAYFNFDNRFEHFLPLQEPSAGDEAEPEFRRPFAIIENPELPGKYVYVDRLEAVEGCSNHHVSVSTRELGFYVRGSFGHTLAKGIFTADSDFDPQADYRTMAVTVFLATDVMAKVVYEVPGNAGASFARDLVIERPNAEVWYAAPQTIEDVTNGDPAWYNAGAPALIRDDTAELRQLAASAAAWHGMAKNNFTLEQSGIAPGLGVGTMIRAAMNSVFSFVPIGTVVTRQVMEFADNRMRVETGYEELDVMAVQQ